MFKTETTDNGVTFRVRVKPGADKNEIVGVQGDALKVKINAPRIKGKANKALTENGRCPYFKASFPSNNLAQTLALFKRG